MNLRSTLALALALAVALPAHASAANKTKPKRDLAPAAIIVGTFAVGTFLAGALLYSMTPRPFLQPTAYRNYRRDRAGIALMSMGGALVIPTIVLGVLAHRRAREERAARNAPVLSLTPHLGARGGGAEVQLRF